MGSARERPDIDSDRASAPSISFVLKLTNLSVLDGRGASLETPASIAWASQAAILIPHLAYNQICHNLELSRWVNEGLHAEMEDQHATRDPSPRGALP